MESPQPAESEPTLATTTKPDNPGVHVPPPVFYTAGYAIGLVAQWLLPVPFFSGPVVRAVGFAVAAAGVLCNVVAIRTLIRHHGTLSTVGSSADLVTAGPYRLSRNPIYVGLTLGYVGLAIIFANVWGLIFTIPLVALTTYGTIMPEERYLERTFGDRYRAYAAHVRRWI